MPPLEDRGEPSPTAYWRSLAERADTPEFRAFLEAEFPSADDPAGISRRRWLQLMGASLALAGSTGCRWKKDEIVPFVSQPENRLPGEPLRFATAMELDGAALGLLVTSVDGRPIKIEGNPHHPASLGATDVFAQASILQLYDPDRSQAIVQRDAGGDAAVRTWDEFTRFARPHFDELKKIRGAGLWVLAESSASPAIAALRARFLKQFPRARWCAYEPVSDDNQRAAARLAFGQPYRVHPVLDRAEVILCLDADILHGHPDSVRHGRKFAEGRAPEEGRMSRLYAVESCFSITGGAADHRLPLRSDAIAWFVQSLAMEIAQGPGTARQPQGEEGAKILRFLRAVAKDLTAHRGESLVVAGPRQPAEVHALVHEINATLENVGKTLRYTTDPEPDRPSSAQSLSSLAAEIRQAKVETLVVLGPNPLYNAPAELQFASLYPKIATRIHLGLYRDETGRESTWHVPQAHWLESWGDVRSFDGTYSIVQPLIEPLWGGKSSLELVAFFLGDDAPKGYELVRAAFHELAPSSDEAKWKAALHQGLLENTASPAVNPKLTRSFLPEEPPLLNLSEINGQDLEIVFCRSHAVHDGRFANSGWLQELPDPLTKLTWDNAALFSPATAAALGVENRTIVRLRFDGRTVEMPAYVMPGQARGSVAVTLGYGRTAAGTVGGDAAQSVPPVGANAYALRTSGAADFARGLAVEPTGRAVALAMTQDHHAIDLAGLKAREARLGELVREANLDHYRQHPDFAKHAVHHPPLESLWKEHEYGPHRWGMAIDLTKCTGCNACMVACQAENNVPVVGKDRVLRGREMHWLRVDRYFQGDPDDPRTVHQLVLCQQCENAPCEPVCPVGATVHSKEGLNDMVYNRCIGTRYCGNNCPYKVRRFNYFNYHKDLEDPAHEVLKMLYNPEVTVRSRGVMEKCTFCVQRIQAVKIEAKNQRRVIRDGELRTACQQACPAAAIEFGDLADPQSAVARLHAAQRAYGLLAELNTKPRNAYLARIRNPNPELEPPAHDHDRPTG